ncbi:MAG: DMT family transporter [Nitrospinae bacterium]|nr:DMT family transporter [Nitrospinota bacterium]
MSPESNAYGVLLGSIASAAWAVFVYFIKRALMNAPVLKVTAAVTTVNAAMVTIIAIGFISIDDFQAVTKATLAFALLAGFLHIGISRSFYYRAIHRIGPNRSIPIALTYPAITAVAAAFTLGETPTLSIFIGLAILLVGITLIVQAEPSREAEGETRGARWKLFGWISAGVTSLLWGVAAIFFKKASLNLHPLATAAIALWVGAATALLLMTLSRGEESRGPIPASAWRWIFAAAVCQSIAVPFYNFAFVHTLAVRVTALVSAQPLIVLALGWLFLREMENITPRLVLGALLTVGGTIFVIT